MPSPPWGSCFRYHGCMEGFLHITEHVLGHAIADTLYLIPFLYLTYLFMEWLEHKTGNKTQEAIRHAGAAGPIVGALLGAVPQCGFSAVSATMYAGRVITLGTLFAVFLSTSDEMLPIFIAEQVPLPTILYIIGTKVVIGMVMGFIIDAVLRLNCVSRIVAAATATAGCAKRTRSWPTSMPTIVVRGAITPTMRTTIPTTKAGRASRFRPSSIPCR